MTATSFVADLQFQQPAGFSRRPLAGGVRFELRPYRSLDAVGARAFMASIAVVSFAAAGLATLHGAWPALVFAALEVAAVYAALRVSLRAREDLHSVSVDDRCVTVHIAERRRSADASLLRHWTRVRLQQGGSCQPARLLIESQGMVLEVGSFLTEPDRRALAQELVGLIGRMGESPRLDAAGSNGPAPPTGGAGPHGLAPPTEVTP